MNAVPEPSGILLARQGLLATRETAKEPGAAWKKPRRWTTTVSATSAPPRSPRPWLPSLSYARAGSP
ncbi:hypothetical protein [Streptomyces sp. NPDC094049]|uniref:hypothetical protein n=1 Tax=Streptomyces sp. NPDC094049 TaxID=3154987 RepID=UPI00331A08CB